MHRFKTSIVAAAAIAACAFPGIIKADVASSLAMASPDIKNLVPSFTAAAAADGDQSSETVLHMRVTAYSSTPDQTDDTPFVTASGLPVGDGIIASNILPFGTKVQIPELFGDKIFVVEDRMSQRIKNTIDIWMPNRTKAIYFGVHTADIVIVTAAKTASAAFTANVGARLAISER